MPPPVEHARDPRAALTRWFSDEVHAHEASLRSYVRGAFPSVRDVDDVVQESYLRIWRARLARPIAASKSFLFTVARHIAIDAVRRARRSPFDLAVPSGAADAPAEAPLTSEVLGVQEKIALLGEAVGSLPDRCRQIITLHKVVGLSQREVAGRLGLAEKTVENQVAIGVRRCEEFFRERGIEHF